MTPETKRSTDAPSSPTPPRRTTGRRGPLRALLDLFSSVRFGIVLLVLLFIYCSVGSAGVIYPIHPNLFRSESWVHAQLRQFRPFELTEFEWFHWWPFDLLIALICTTLVITTVRRIRLNVVNLGVWMIHTGIVVLSVGSVVYFSTKVEGDVPVIRRQIIATVRGSTGSVSTNLLAMPGARAELESDGKKWQFEVAEIDPSWEIRSGSDAGKNAYSVNVLVQTPEGRFIRQLLAGFPEYTEDVLFTNDEHQPMQRAVKAIGKPIVDESLLLALEYEPAIEFYLKNDAVKSWALYVRKPGAAQWHQRPIKGLPLYNDFIASDQEVFQAGGAEQPADPLDIKVPPQGATDPFPDLSIRITSYLRFAQTRTMLMPGDAQAPLNPVLWFSIGLSPERTREYRLFAMDAAQRRADEGLLVFRWVEDAAALAALSRQPSLEFDVPSAGLNRIEPVLALAAATPDLEFTPLAGTPYSYRVRTIEDDLPLESGTAALAIVEMRRAADANGPAREWRRWVFDDPALTRDVTDEGADPAHEAARLIDDAIRVRYTPGVGRAVLTIVGGPGVAASAGAENAAAGSSPNDPRALALIVANSNRPTRRLPLRVGEPLDVGSGLRLVASEYFLNAVSVTKPFVVPREQRTRDAGEFFAQIRVDVDGPGASPARFANGVPWLTFHRYPFANAERTLRRNVYSPSVVTLADGRTVELMFSRQSLPLPAPVALEEFVLASHVGGFTGESSSIRNYTSRVRFLEGDRSGASASVEASANWSDPIAVSVNEPIERDGWWFFQAQWDPPDDTRVAGRRASAGLNYTILGVGNRHGVHVQLIGCCIAVLGMIYAFYVKPVIKRRRQRAVAEQVEAMKARGELPKRSGSPKIAGSATVSAGEAS